MGIAGRKPRNPQLVREAKLALKYGMKRFTPSEGAICPIHKGEHYTASRRCCECTRLAKSPEKQAAYWQTVKDPINQKKREEYLEKKLSTP